MFSVIEALRPYSSQLSFSVYHGEKNCRSVAILTSTSQQGETCLSCTIKYQGEPTTQAKKVTHWNSRYSHWLIVGNTYGYSKDRPIDESLLL